MTAGQGETPAATRVDLTRISRAVREAMAVVEQELPLLAAAGPPNRPRGDLRELRRTAFQVILTKLVQAAPGDTVTPETPVPGREALPVGADREWLGTGSAARLLGASDSKLRDLEADGTFHPARSPSGRRMWFTDEIEAYKASLRGQRSDARINHIDGRDTEIARMHVVDNLPFHVIASKFGLSKSTTQKAFRRWASTQFLGEAAAAAPASPDSPDSPDSEGN